MSKFDNYNLNTEYKQRELDMLPQTGTTTAQAVGEMGNHVSGDLIGRALNEAAMIDAAYSVQERARNGARLIRELVDALRALPTSAPAVQVEGEPVAWIVPGYGVTESRDFAGNSVAMSGDPVTPLYTHPDTQEIARLREHADLGWALYTHWNARYLDCAIERDRIEGRLAEVEAERDAIGAAMVEACAKAMGTFHWNRYADERLSGPCVFSSHTHQKVEQICRALADPSSKATLDKLIADAVQSDRAAANQNYADHVSSAPASAGVTVKPLEDALSFYADASAWNQPPVRTKEGLLSIEYENQASRMQRDRGRIAREALTTAQSVSEGGE